MQKAIMSGESGEDTDRLRQAGRAGTGRRSSGPDRKPWPFTAENLEAMVELTPGFALGFQSSYQRAWLGQGKVREKNSDGSPADGRAGEPPETKPRA
jgi:hypothetical protein